MALDQVTFDKKTALASGVVLAAGWYATAAAVLPGPFGQVIPALGAILIAGGVPLYLQNRRPRADDPRTAAHAHADALMNHHAIVSVVDADNRLTEVNAAFLEALGVSREEALGREIDSFYTDDSRAAVVAIRQQLDTGETWQGDLSMMRSDGSVFFTHTTVMPLYDDAGNCIGAVSARTDVTDSYRQSSQRETAEALDELKDDIWVVDAKTEAFTYMNRSACTRLGLRADTVPGRRLRSLCPDPGIEKIIEACRALRTSGRDGGEIEVDYQGRCFRVSIRSLRFGSEMGRYLILFQDLSEQIEEERRKSDFISTVSHELRSPLTSIKGAMGLLLSRATGELPEKAVSLLEIAHRNADRLVLIINDILDLEKLSQGQMEFDRRNVNLVDLIAETKQANAGLHQRFEIEFISEHDQTPIWVRTDPNRIIQVLTNFLSNAGKFSRPGSRVWIGLEDQGEHVRVSVRDEGPGIPLKDRGKIFERFADMTNSDRASKGGTGLGLSICKAIVESLGGTIGFETKEGVGTTFYFYLPKPELACVPADNTLPLRNAS